MGVKARDKEDGVGGRRGGQAEGGRVGEGVARQTGRQAADKDDDEEPRNNTRRRSGTYTRCRQESSRPHGCRMLGETDTYTPTTQ